MKPVVNFNHILALSDIAPECPTKLGSGISIGLQWDSNETTIARLAFLENPHRFKETALPSPASQALFEKTRQQLQAWFSNPHFTFTLPLATPPTPFQKRLREHLVSMPSGSVCTYGALAKILESAPRAVGQALASNPIPLIVPCHRVISNGKNRLTGFNHQSDGIMLALKAWLLERETSS